MQKQIVRQTVAHCFLIEKVIKTDNRPVTKRKNTVSPQRDTRHAASGYPLLCI
jgi:hypothetical protein